MNKIAILGSGKGPDGTAIVPAPIAEIVGDGFEAGLIENRLQVFPGTPEHREVNVLEYLEAAYRAEDEGYAAAFINTIGDYGLLQARSQVNIPVIGAGESAMLLATTLGQRFSIVTIWPPSLVFLYDAVLDDYQLRHRCASVRFVTADAELGTKEEYVSDMNSQRTSIVDRVVAECERAVQEDHCDVIVLGCTCMAPIAPLVGERCSVPVIDGMRTGYKFAEMTVALGLTPRLPALDQRSHSRSEVDELLKAAATIEPFVCEPCEVIAQAAQQ
jgi:allantoin racemase